MNLHTKTTLVLLTLFCFSCKTLTATKTKEPGAGALAQNPGSCVIAGKIISVNPALDPDTGSICHKYPCKAIVKILSVSRGSTVAQPVLVGDEVEINFAYTLTKTKIAMPEMKSRFPGLKVGSTFDAELTQHPKPGGGVVFTVFDYSIDNGK